MRRRLPRVQRGAPVAWVLERGARPLRQARGGGRPPAAAQQLVPNLQQGAARLPQCGLDQQHRATLRERQRVDQRGARTRGKLGQRVRDDDQVELPVQSREPLAEVGLPRPDGTPGESAGLGKRCCARIERQRRSPDGVEQRQRRGRRACADVERARPRGDGRERASRPGQREDGLHLRVRLRPPPQQVRAEMGRIVVSAAVRQRAAAHQALVQGRCRLGGAAQLARREPIGRTGREAEQGARAAEQRWHAVDQRGHRAGG